MSLAAAPIELSDGDRDTLERWVRADSTPQGVARRAWVILQAADGVSNSEIAPSTWRTSLAVGVSSMNNFLTGKLRSLCTKCHNRLWAVDKRGYSTAVDATGKPIDPRHPALKE